MAGLGAGGSFAPPITKEMFAAYKKIAGSGTTPAPVKDAMAMLLVMVEKFQQTPKSKAPSARHPSGRGTITKLEEAEIKRMDPHVPWKHELDSLTNKEGTGLFDQISAETDKPLRDAAFHLLWYGYELTADREPCTADML